jgi:hypothetical protein
MTYEYRFHVEGFNGFAFLIPPGSGLQNEPVLAL